jgi:transposase-like protein
MKSRKPRRSPRVPQRTKNRIVRQYADGKLSQAQLAAMHGVSQATVSRIVAGAL